MIKKRSNESLPSILWQLKNMPKNLCAPNGSLFMHLMANRVLLQEQHLFLCAFMTVKACIVFNSTTTTVIRQT
jgi:hypothetical protein